MVILWSNEQSMVADRGEFDRHQILSWRGFAGFMVIWSLYSLLSIVLISVMCMCMVLYGIVLYVCMYVYIYIRIGKKK